MSTTGLTPEEQELFDFAMGSLPRWMPPDDETIQAAAKIFADAKALGVYLFSQALIKGATGPNPGTPDWLNQHARDRGTSRQNGETDPALRDRLRTIPDALTRQAVLDAANAVLVSDGVPGTAALLELPRDGAFAGKYTALSGIGGTFVQNGTSQQFTPTTLPWPVPPYQAATVTPFAGWQLVISGAANGANNGTNTITGLVGNAAVVTNAAGVAGPDAGVAWKAQRVDQLGNVTDGFARAFADRGFRATGRRLLVVMLPYGASAGTAASVSEAVRTKKAGGFAYIVERRLNP